MLNINETQKDELEKLKMLGKFKVSKVIPVLLTQLIELENRGYKIVDILDFLNQELKTDFNYFTFYRAYNKLKDNPISNKNQKQKQGVKSEDRQQLKNEDKQQLENKVKKEIEEKSVREIMNSSSKDLGIDFDTENLRSLI